MSVQRNNPAGSVNQQVRYFWNDASCGENLYLQTVDLAGYRSQAAERYRLEPIILPFADFDSAKGKKVLEIGVGLGADHQCFAEAGGTCQPHIDTHLIINILFGIPLQSA